MPQRLAGQLLDGGDPVADEPVFVVDTGPADETTWSIVATDRSAADGSWSVTVPSADVERYHAVAQFEESGTLKNALSKPFLTSQPFAQAGAVNIGFNVLDPTTIGSAISDSVVDNFESADADPAGVYESGETIADYYSGDTGSYGRTATNAVEGSTALETNTATAADHIVSEPDDGLNRYPSNGDTILFLIRDPGANPHFLFNAGIDASGLDAYDCRIAANFTDEEISIEKITDDSRTTLSTSTGFSGSVDTWYWGEIDTPTSGDASMTFRLYAVNTNDLTRGSLLDSVSASDNDHIGNDGVGAFRQSGSDTGTILDWIRIDE